MPNWIKNIINISSPNLDKIKGVKDFFKDLDFNKIIETPDTLNIVSGEISDEAYALYLDLIGKKSNNLSGLLLPDSIFIERAVETIKELPIIPNPKDPKDKIGLTSEDISYLYMSDDISTKPKNRADFIMLGRIQYINILKYSVKDWYDYHLKNWGTKWSGLYNWESEKKDWYTEFEANGVYNIRYKFRTAWSFPDGIITEFLYKFGFMYDIFLSCQFADEFPGNGNYGWFIKDYNYNAFNAYQLQLIDIKPEDGEKYTEMVWNS